MGPASESQGFDTTTPNKLSFRTALPVRNLQLNNADSPLQRPRVDKYFPSESLLTAKR
jgi:hypothetical protein